MGIVDLQSHGNKDVGLHLHVVVTILLTAFAGSCRSATKAASVPKRTGYCIVPPGPGEGVSGTFDAVSKPAAWQCGLLGSIGRSLDGPEASLAE